MRTSFPNWTWLKTLKFQWLSPWCWRGGGKENLHSIIRINTETILYHREGRTITLPVSISLQSFVFGDQHLFGSPCFDLVNTKWSPFSVAPTSPWYFIQAFPPKNIGVSAKFRPNKPRTTKDISGTSISKTGECGLQSWRQNLFKFPANLPYSLLKLLGLDFF